MKFQFTSGSGPIECMRFVYLFSYANIRKAKERLKEALKYKEAKERARVREERWFNVINIVRGNEKMKFKGNNFKRVK